MWAKVTLTLASIVLLAGAVALAVLAKQGGRMYDGTSHPVLAVSAIIASLVPIGLVFGWQSLVRIGPVFRWRFSWGWRVAVVAFSLFVLIFVRAILVFDEPSS